MMKTQWLWTLALLLSVPTCLSAQTQNTKRVNHPGDLPFSRVNHLASLARSGNTNADVQLVHQLFINVGVSPNIADVFGFTDRIVQAETEFSKGELAPIPDSVLVQAVNNAANTIGAPQWSHTNQQEMRRLRMHMLVLYPQLIADQGRPDAKGHYHALKNTVSPMEAAYIGLTMMYQKIYNPNYQFTEAERAANASLSPSENQSKHIVREETMLNILSGKTQSISIQDLLAVADRFFDDLGIEPATYNNALNRQSSISSRGGE